MLLMQIYLKETYWSLQGKLLKYIFNFLNKINKIQ